MSSWFTHTWTRCPSQRASPVTSRGAQLIGPQRRRIHDQHLTIELDHRPHTDLLAQRVRCVVPVSGSSSGSTSIQSASSAG